MMWSIGHYVITLNKNINWYEVYDASDSIMTDWYFSSENLNDCIHWCDENL